MDASSSPFSPTLHSLYVDYVPVTSLDADENDYGHRARLRDAETKLQRHSLLHRDVTSCIAHYMNAESASNSPFSLTLRSPYAEYVPDLSLDADKRTTKGAKHGCTTETTLQRCLLEL